MSQKKQNIKRNKKAARKQKPEYRSVVPRGVMTMADKQVVQLELFDQYTLNSLGQTRVYTTNALYDPYVPLGGPSVTGFNSWVTFYNYYRVLKFSIDLQCSNLEVYPVTLFFAHANSDPGTSIVNYSAYASQGYGFVKQLGPATGVSDFRYKRNLTPRHLVGDRLTMTAERFVGSSTANPADLTFFGVGVDDTISSLANGVRFVYRVQYLVEFFDRKPITDSVFAKAAKQAARK